MLSLLARADVAIQRSWLTFPDEVVRQYAGQVFPNLPNLSQSRACVGVRGRRKAPLRRRQRGLGGAGLVKESHQLFLW